MSTNDVGLVPLIIGSLVGFAALLTIIWNFSKTITTMKINIANQDKKHIEDINEIKVKLEQSKTERRDEIRDSLENQTKKFEAVQDQIDGMRSDVKDISSRVTQNDQKAKYADEAINEIKKILFDHFTVWNQRIENRIEELRKEFLGMFRAFHGHGNNGKHE